MSATLDFLPPSGPSLRWSHDWQINTQPQFPRKVLFNLFCSSTVFEKFSESLHASANIINAAQTCLSYAQLSFWEKS